MSEHSLTDLEQLFIILKSGITHDDYAYARKVITEAIANEPKVQFNRCAGLLADARDRLTQIRNMVQQHANEYPITDDSREAFADAEAKLSVIFNLTNYPRS